VKLINMYGPTETTVVVCHFPFDNDHPMTTIGKPLPNVQFYVLDDNLQAVAPGSAGELFIGGIQVSEGYWNAQDLTRERFITHPRPSAADIENGWTRLYRTGDIVRILEDGNTEFVTRKDNQLKFHGFRIEPEEVEIVLNHSRKVDNNCLVVNETSSTPSMLLDYYIPSLQLLKERMSAGRDKIDPAVIMVAEDEISLDAVVPFLLSEEELSSTIHEYIVLLNGNGKIMINDVGDYRSMWTLKCAQVRETYPADAIIEPEVVYWQADQLIRQEDKLCLSPLYFRKLTANEQAITRISFDYHRDNDYSVTIYLGTTLSAPLISIPDDRPGSHPLSNLPLYTYWWGDMEREIKEYLSERLPEYMIPGRFIPVDRLLLTPNGKLDRRSLAAETVIWQAVSGATTTSYTAPRSELESQLASIWTDILRSKRIGIDDHFIHHGGNSLIAARITAAMRHDLAIGLSVMDLFDHPTIRELASWLSDSDRQTGLLPVIQPAGPGQKIPLSFQQQGLWFLDKLHGTLNYHIATWHSLDQPVNAVLLEQAFQLLIQRQAVLRSVIHEEEGSPWQRIIPVDGWRLGRLEIAPAVDPSSFDESLLSLINSPFDLSTDYMIRAWLINKDHLLLVMHHIASDGWSLSLVLQELTELYDSLCEAREPSLPVLPVSYADYVIWQRTFLDETRMNKVLSYWRGELDGVRPLSMPTDLTRPRIQSLQGLQYGFTMDDSLYSRLQQFSSDHAVTLYMTLLAGLYLLLWRYSGEEDLCIGTPVANRPQVLLEPLAGYFVNLLAIRCRLKDNPSFFDLLAQIRKTTLEAYLHQDAPFDKVVNDILPQRDPGYHPLFQVVFILQNAFMQGHQRKGQRLQLRPEAVIGNHTSKFDLQFEVMETGKGLTITIEYSTTLFRRDTVQRMGRHYINLISAMLAAPTARIGSLEMLDREEKDLLLTGLNNTRHEWPDQTLVDLFRAQAERMPDRKAIVMDDTCLTYRELDEQSDQLARYLILLGAEKDRIIPFCLPQIPLKICCMLAILKAGSAYLAIDPSYSTSRIDHMLKDSGAGMVITISGYKELFGYAGTRLIFLDKERALTGEGIPVPPRPDDLAYVGYTSGTTGIPKGILIEHRSLSNFIRHYARLLDISANDRTLQFASVSFDGAVIDIWIPLIKGAELHLYPNNRIVGESLLAFLITHGITRVPFITPSVLATLPESPDPVIVGVIGIGGEACAPSLSEHWRNKVKLVNMYGPTETTVAVNEYVYDSIHPPFTLGRPIGNTAFYVLDKFLLPVPIGVIGELYIAGTPLARGYLNLPELTASVFMSNPFVTGDKPGMARMYRTGDRVRYLADGLLEFVGRDDQQVKIRGHRVELSGIETLLLKVPGIRQAVAIVKERSGIIAYLVHEDGVLSGNTAAAVINGIQRVLSDQLPNYMLPAEYVFLERMPVNEIGKIHIGGLPVAVHASLSVSAGAEQEGLAMTTGERMIAGIWKAVLNISAVGPDDDFFLLGGHSLSLTMVHSRLPDPIRESITMHDLYECSTIRLLSQRIESRTGRKGVLSGKEKSDMEQRLLNDISIPFEIPTGLQPVTIPSTGPVAILLTGATGFVGIHLLTELLLQTQATIYLLVRAKNEQEAEASLIKSMVQQQLSLSGFARDRIVIVCGNLSRPLLGLSQTAFDKLAGEIDMIYHCGSSVNFIKPYSAMKAPNVEGMQEILRLATTHTLKPISLLSAVAIFGWEYYFTRKKVYTEADNGLSSLPYLTQDLGYTQSKWVMDQIAQLAIARGIPIAIFRVGYVLCHSVTGATEPGQWWSRLVRTCLELKSYPLLKDQLEEFVTVDFVCKAIVRISQNPDARGKIFNISPLSEDNISLEAFFMRLQDYFGLNITPQPFREWLKRWENNENSPLYPLLSMFRDEVYDGNSIIEMYQHAPDFDTKNTAAFLEGSGIPFPHLDKALLAKYLTFLGGGKYPIFGNKDY
jgi:amino acid adenylation domain-containing protein/thioester reductase-like protein